MLHALHNSQDTDPVHQEHKWRTRNVVIHTVRNNTIQVEDRENQEHIKIATEPGKSQLNLGHAVGRDDKARGFGFELRLRRKSCIWQGLRSRPWSCRLKRVATRGCTPRVSRRRRRRPDRSK
ncbi:type VI secretion system Vgr family protein [Caballeronia turbans]|uniref:type VI secretion system Vgr family protein n=1 Tax=Caballeronia sp. INML2 TaxID=2921748 RepID=UPI000B350176